MPPHRSDTDAPHTGARARWRIVLLLTACVAGVSAGGWWWRRQPADTATPVAALESDSLARAPLGTRVIVRVVNASGTRGLARRGMLQLRLLGYDVVDFDTDRASDLATTEIIVHTGKREWGERVRRALGVGTIVLTPDPLRDVDVTVRLGRDWRAPAEPLRP
ncbi:MAG: LytR C-terminal domain-containing protein [Gemmatimonadetes bacterium]|nr:LytR C-terminal domain-containing protein [Gemmatimonadota bacterium]